MPTKKLIKEFVRCIQKHDYPTAKSLLATNPDLIVATCSAPPKKYDGQSLLQIAARNAAAPIVADLANAGADINFMESSDINEWTSPVLHDAVNSAVWATLQQPSDFIERMIAAIDLLLTKGADPNMTDSYGTTALQRFLRAARSRVGDVYYKGPYKSKNDRLKYLKQIHDLLIENGAHATYTNRDGSEMLNETDRFRIGIS